MPIVRYKFCLQGSAEHSWWSQVFWEWSSSWKGSRCNYVNLQFFITIQPLGVGLQSFENQPEEGQIDSTEPSSTRKSGQPSGISRCGSKPTSLCQMGFSRHFATTLTKLLVLFMTILSSTGSLPKDRGSAWKLQESRKRRKKGPTLQRSFQQIRHLIDLRGNTSHPIPLLSSFPTNKDHEGVIESYCSYGGKHTDTVIMPAIRTSQQSQCFP